MGTHTARPVAELLAIYDQWLRRVDMPALFGWQTGVFYLMDMRANLPSSAVDMTPRAFVTLVQKCAEWITENPYECLNFPESKEAVENVWANNGVYVCLAITEKGRPASDFIDARHAYDTAADDAVIKMAKEQVEAIKAALPTLAELISRN